MFDNPQGEPQTEFSVPQITAAIHTIIDLSLFDRFRGNINTNRGMFARGAGYAAPEFSTQTVLNNWVKGMEAGDPVVTKTFSYDPETIRRMVEFNQSGICLRILMAYWGVVPDTPWDKTHDRIVTRQTHSSRNFPNQDFINEMVTKVTSPPQEYTVY